MGFSLRRFRAGWGQDCVIDELDLQLQPGELLMIVGPGGSGKSTLLTAIEDLVNAAPDGSDPWWEGEIEVGFTRAARLPQNGRTDAATLRMLAPSLADDHRLWPSDVRLRDELLVALDVPLRELPNPLRRLVGFLLTAANARTDAGELLLFDEPDFGQRGAWLDHVHAVFAELRAAQHSMVAVTHYLPLARSMADRVGLMIDGRMIELAPTREFFDAPKQERTQQFIKWGA